MRQHHTHHNKQKSICKPHRASQHSASSQSNVQIFRKLCMLDFNNISTYAEKKQDHLTPTSPTNSISSLLLRKKQRRKTDLPEELKKHDSHHGHRPQLRRVKATVSANQEDKQKKTTGQ